jgi:hypothetical protein
MTRRATLFLALLVQLLTVNRNRRISPTAPMLLIRDTRRRWRRLETNNERRNVIHPHPLIRAERYAVLAEPRTGLWKGDFR